MLYQDLELAPNIDTSSASTAAYVHWIVSTAKRLELLDDEVIEGWVLGEFTDFDVLDNISRHGAWAEILSSRSPVTRTANVLHACINNTLGALMVDDVGNFEMRR